jgi:TonB family protein
MESIKIKKEKNEILPAISISLLIHIALGAFIFFFLSGNSNYSPALNGLNLVWVSLDSKSENISGHDHTRHLSPAEKSINKITNAEWAKKDEQVPGNNNNAADGITDKTSHWGNVIAYPLYKENAPPVYPEIARVRGYEGIVLVFAEILPDGRVGKIKIRKSSGYAILDQSAISAVKPWKFEPAKKSGSPFTAWVELPIKFILNSNSQS